MTEEIWSADKAKLHEVRGHLFDMEDHITRAEEALDAMAGLLDIENPARYKAALNCISDIVKEQIGETREAWHQAFDAAGGISGAEAAKIDGALKCAERLED